MCIPWGGTKTLPLRLYYVSWRCLPRLCIPTLPWLATVWTWSLELRKGNAERFLSPGAPQDPAQFQSQPTASKKTSTLSPTIPRKLPSWINSEEAAKPHTRLQPHLSLWFQPGETHAKDSVTLCLKFQENLEIRNLCHSKILNLWLGFLDSLVGKESICNVGYPSLIPGWGRSAGEGIGYSWASLVAQLVKNPPALEETWVRKIPWRRERPPTPGFWPGELNGLYSPWGHKESDMTEQLSFSSLWSLVMQE